AVVSGAAGELVRPPAAVQHVIARAAVDLVGAAVADDGVGEAVAGAVDRGASGQGEVLDLGCERVGDRGLDQVCAAAGELDHRIQRIVHDIGVVARAAGEGVGPCPAIEDVVAGIAGDHVDRGVAGAVDVANAGESEILDLGGEGVGDGGGHAVDAAAGRFHDGVGDV